MNAYLTLRLPADLARALARWARMRRLPAERRSPSHVGL